MQAMNNYLWLLQTDKGEYFITVVGYWTQEEAADKVRLIMDKIGLKLTGMIPRKQATGPDDARCTIYQTKDAKSGLGFDFIAGRKLWYSCGRGAEYDAEMVRLKVAGKEQEKMEEKEP